jgi:hypothetical protein
MFVAVGAGVLIGLALTAYFARLDFDYSNRTAAYDAAPICASADNVSTCRFEGPATIVRKRTDSNGDPLVDLRFDQLGGELLTAYPENRYQAEWQGWQEGTTVATELWQGVVTKVADVTTRGNPDELPKGGLIAVLVFGIATLALLAGMVVLWTLNRRAAGQVD